MTLEERVEKLEKDLAAFQAQIGNAPIADANKVVDIARRLSKVEEQLGIADK